MISLNLHLQADLAQYAFVKSAKTEKLPYKV